MSAGTYNPYYDLETGVQQAGHRVGAERWRAAAVGMAHRVAPDM